MSKINRLVASYSKYIAIPWRTEAAAAQRVIFCVYNESDELRLRAKIDEFELATRENGHEWAVFDLTDSFAEWMTDQKYAHSYFQKPNLLATLYPKYQEFIKKRIFHGHPCGSMFWDEDSKWTAHGPLRSDETVLQVAVARLLGYRWPAELDSEMELADEQRKWVERCEELLPYADKDGIVCIPSVRGEMKAEDRLENLLVLAYGDEWSSNKKTELLANAGHAGKTLETWLRDKFFPQHCKLFHHRPYIWHIWDGLRDGFAVLVNYHKLDGNYLETLIYNYLGDWIIRQKQDIENSVDGAQEKLAAAESLKKKLEMSLKGEEPYDIFVRWKPMEKQPLGWDPYLNDGVRLNIRPFMTVPDVGKRGRCPAG